jgi:glycerate 2-kinase
MCPGPRDCQKHEQEEPSGTCTGADVPADRMSGTSAGARWLRDTHRSGGHEDRGLCVVIAPDSFKGSLTSVEVANALAAGWLAVRPGDRVRLAPLADGGEGTLAALEAAGGWQRRLAAARDPLGRMVSAAWLVRDDGAAACVEMAAASGLSRVAVTERDPVRASTHGTGDVVAAVLDAGVRDIVLGIGGSATTDGGAGFLAALGAVIGEGDLGGPWSADLRGLDPRLAQARVRVACDVTNPLLGRAGAAAVYGPQKGATPDEVGLLDARLGRFADAMEVTTGRRERDTPGAGAAGGLGFALLSIQDRLGSLEVTPGVDLVAEAVGLGALLRDADLVITGEGCVDWQSAFGKTAFGVAGRAKSAGIPCMVIGGTVTDEGREALAGVGAVAVPVTDPPVPVSEAMAAGSVLVESCGRRIARLMP